MTHYERGRKWEWAVKEQFEKEGCLVCRSAGSKGVCDLMVLFPGGMVFLIECKIRKGLLKKSERKKMNDYTYTHDCKSFLAYPRHGPSSKKDDNVILEEL